MDSWFTPHAGGLVVNDRPKLNLTRRGPRVLYPAVVSRNQEARRIDSLTGIRIVAAGSVFLSHSHIPSDVPGPIRTFMMSGYNGVTLFFTLSGFVLAWNYADRLTPPTRRAVWSFFVARFARIYPLYLAALLWALGPFLLAGTVSLGYLWPQVIAIQAWSADLIPAYNGPAWSISVEALLYACLPLLIFVLGPARRHPRFLFGIIVACVAVLAALAWWFTITGRADLPWTDRNSAHRWLYRTPVTRLGDFTVGICLALIVRQVRAREWIGTCAQLVGAAGIVVVMLTPSLLYSAWSWDVAYLVPTAMLLWGLAAAPRSWLGRALSTRPVVVLGEASYAFYLFHFLILDRLQFVGVDRRWEWVLVLLLQFAFTAVFSIGAHVAIELPAQRWLRSRLDRRPRPAVSDHERDDALEPSLSGSRT